MAKGLLALGGTGTEDDYDPSMYEDDAKSMGPDEGDDMLDSTAGPFEAYADTVLNVEAPIEDRTEALRQAIQTIIEEGSMSEL